MLRNTLYLLLVFLFKPGDVINSPIHSADLPSAFDDNASLQIVEDEMKKMKALLDMAAECGDVKKYTHALKYAPRKYIWDKLPKQTTKTPDEEQKLREAQKISYRELIKNHVVNELPPNLQNSIFKHKLSDLTAPNTNAVLARKLSFFYMEEMNLFVINESLKFLKCLDTWFIKHFGLSDGQLDWSKKFDTWENIIEKIVENGKGRSGDYGDLAMFPMKMFRALAEIGPRQAEYSEYMARNFSENFPPMNKNVAEKQGEVKFDVMKNGMFSARKAVTDLISTADGVQWIEPSSEAKIKAYLD
ncbi:hypothetical protein DdX_16735 [Ditylenchus destructor]|uniref:Uncharacterized protein n=1 Tax=Ditylenchus destructor TaxID=166010 RepID=A0AAD4MP24_9BILA|nr:hypothetical protein DdX_16735 [Ditylenchus destructor]